MSSLMARLGERIHDMSLIEHMDEVFSAISGLTFYGRDSNKIYNIYSVKTNIKSQNKKPNDGWVIYRDRSPQRATMDKKGIWHNVIYDSQITYFPSMDAAIKSLKKYCGEELIPVSKLS